MGGCRLDGPCRPEPSPNAPGAMAGSDKRDGISMDRLIALAARALSAGDVLTALKLVALRTDPPALALRGIVMARLGDLPRARALLRDAARAFGADDAVALARCRLALAEIALVARDPGRPVQALGAVRATLAAHGDHANAAHAGYLQARHRLLTGHLDAAGQTLDAVDVAALPPASLAGYRLVEAGIAMRRIRAAPARAALILAAEAARAAGIPALIAEVDRAKQLFDAPAACTVGSRGQQWLRLDAVEALLASDALIVDTGRHLVRAGTIRLSLAGRPVLLALARALAEGWPGAVPRETLIARAFGGREADETHRARLRVEIGRLRALIRPLARLRATTRGFVLMPSAAGTVTVLVPPVDGAHGDVLALLSDGEAWSTSALAGALGVSPRTVQRALEVLARLGKVERCGRGRACRWMAPTVPGFPTSLLLPAEGPNG